MGSVRIKIVKAPSAEFSALGIRGLIEAPLYLQVIYSSKFDYTQRVENIPLKFLPPQSADGSLRFDMQWIMNRFQWNSYSLQIMHGLGVGNHNTAEVHLATANGDFAFRIFPNGNVVIKRCPRDLDLTIETVGNILKEQPYNKPVTFLADHYFKQQSPMRLVNNNDPNTRTYRSGLNRK